MSGEQFSLVWNSFPRNLSSGLYTLLTDEQLVDVTLAAEGQILRAHKLILSVCSTYFRELFKGNSCKHPIVILKDVNYRDLSAMLHFMYQGEVNIKQEDIASFLKVAETLQIKGLTTESEEKLDSNLEKNLQDLDQLLDTDKHNIDLKPSDTIDSSFEKSAESQSTDWHCPQENVPSESTQTQTSFLERSTIFTDNCCQKDSNSTSDYNAQRSLQPETLSKNCQNTDIQEEKEEPLDCTANVNQMEGGEHEPLDYTLDVDTGEAAYKRYASNKPFYQAEENVQRQDFVPDMQLVPFSQTSQTQPFGVNSVGALQSDFTHDSGCHNKGRRTVKDIPNSSLPLETTLRVISELGPTIRMERGKVVRMYSCPWCLRHFTRKENLKLHVRYIHGPLETLTCKFCGNKYKNSNSLRVHSYLYHNAKRDKHNKPIVGDGV